MLDRLQNKTDVYGVQGLVIEVFCRPFPPRANYVYVQKNLVNDKVGLKVGEPSPIFSDGYVSIFKN